MTRPPVGESGLGAYAREQIERARNDPRLERGSDAVIADFWQAVEEAERVRMLGVLGLHELTHALSRSEQERGVSHTDGDLDFNTHSALQAAWERAESARIELGHGHPQLNAQALLSLCSALDAMAEDLGKTWRAFRVKPMVDHLSAAAARDDPGADAGLGDEARDVLREVVTTHIAKKCLGRAPRLYGAGPDRYERVLAPIGFGVPADRDIPDDLAQALTELNVLRDVFMHRAGRIDLKAMKTAPTLTYKRGQLVRISREDYRRYSAAVRCYAREVLFRGIRSWPNVTDEDGPNLDQWQDYRMIGS